LDDLLQRAIGEGDAVDRTRYDEFRAGLLRHIGMEEKILLPAAQRLQGGAPLAMAAKLKLDHAALACLLMPNPTTPVLETIRAILADHNRLEEGREGLYATCDRLAASEADSLVGKLEAAPGLTVMPHSDSPAVMQTLHRSLERAGYRLYGVEAAKQGREGA
jgi:hypothetical protein